MFLLLALALTLPLRAHSVDSVRLEFQFAEGHHILGGVVDLTYMLPETRGVDEARIVSRWEVMTAEFSEQKRMRDETRKTLRRCLSFSNRMGQIEADLRFPEFESEPLVLPESSTDWAYLTAEFFFDPLEVAEGLTVHWEDETGAKLLIGQIIDGEYDLLEIQPGSSYPLIAAPGLSETLPTAEPFLGLKHWISTIALILSIGVGIMFWRKRRTA